MQEGEVIKINPDQRIAPVQFSTYRHYAKMLGIELEVITDQYDSLDRPTYITLEFDTLNSKVTLESFERMSKNVCLRPSLAYIAALGILANENPKIFKHQKGTMTANDPFRFLTSRNSVTNCTYETAEDGFKAYVRDEASRAIWIKAFEIMFPGHLMSAFFNSKAIRTGSTGIDYMDLIVLFSTMYKISRGLSELVLERFLISSPIFNTYFKGKTYAIPATNWNQGTVSDDDGD